MVWSVRERVGSILCSRVVFDKDVVVGQNAHPSCNSSPDVMSVFPICEVFMVG